MLVSGLVFLPRRPVFPALFRTALTKLVSIVSDVYVNVAYVIFQHFFRWIPKQSVLSEILMMTVAPVIYERVFDRY